MVGQRPAKQLQYASIKQLLDEVECDRYYELSKPRSVLSAEADG